MSDKITILDRFCCLLANLGNFSRGVHTESLITIGTVSDFSYIIFRQSELNVTGPFAGLSESITPL
jgi:hypothetical protein